MRLDQFLVQKFNIESRTKAQELIKKNCVYKIKNDIKIYITKPGYDVALHEESEFGIENSDFTKFVSRAGIKLEKALQKINLNIDGKIALDVGQSTGGFTDCLLQLGANKVIGIEVGSGQIHDKIKNDNRNITFENLNMRTALEQSHFVSTIARYPIDLIVCDVSFISILKILEPLNQILKQGGYFLLLIKPQFECGPEFLDKNGIVSDTAVYDRIQSTIEQECRKIFQSSIIHYFESSLPGRDGNKEYFVYGQKNI